MKSTTLRNWDAVMVARYHYPSSSTAAIITIAATTKVTHILESLQWSYDAVPSSGGLVVTIGGTTVFSIAITAAGPGFINFPVGLHGLPNKAMVITLADPDTGVTGKINAQTK